MYYICNFYFCKLFLYLFCFLPVIAVNRIFIFTFLCFVDKQRRLSSQQYFFLPFDDFFFFFFFFCCRCFFFFSSILSNPHLWNIKAAPRIYLYMSAVCKKQHFSLYWNIKTYVKFCVPYWNARNMLLYLFVWCRSFLAA